MSRIEALGCVSGRTGMRSPGEGRKMCAKAAGCFLEASGLSLEGPQGPHPRPISRCYGTHAASPWTPRTRTHGRAELTYRRRCLSCAATQLPSLGHKTEESQLPEGLRQF